MLFIGLTLVMLFVGVLIMLALARYFDDRTVAEILHWHPTQSPELEVQNELDDVRQMIDAQNALRRKRGAREITEDDVERQAQEDQAVRARGSGPFAQPKEVMDELDAPPPPAPRSRRPPRSS